MSDYLENGVRKKTWRESWPDLPDEACCATCRYFDHTKFDGLGKPNEMNGRCRVPQVTRRTDDTAVTVDSKCYRWEKGSKKIRLRVPAQSQRVPRLPAPGTSDT